MRVLLAALAIGPAATAQPIATDRPDFTESTEVVPRNRVQLEAGATVEWSDGASVAGAPELLLRWAPLRRLEFRLEAPGYSTASEGGFGDAAAGAKLQLGPVSEVGLAAIGMLTVPVGDSARSAGGIDPSLIVTAARDLSAGVGLGIQASGGFVSSDDRVDLGLTLVIGVAVAERVGSFLELAAADLAGDAALVLHHGYTLSLSPDAQLDVHAGVGLAGASPDVFVGVGVAVRR